MPAKLRQHIHDICRNYTLGRLEQVFDKVDEEIEFVVHAPPDILPAISPQKGRAALAALLLKVQAEYEHLSYQPHVVGGDAHTAAVAILARLRRRSTGELIDLFITDFVRFRDDRLVELREYVDRAAGVEQLFARKSSAPK